MPAVEAPTAVASRPRLRAQRDDDDDDRADVPMQPLFGWKSAVLLFLIGAGATSILVDQPPGTQAWARERWAAIAGSARGTPADRRATPNGDRDASVVAAEPAPRARDAGAHTVDAAVANARVAAPQNTVAAVDAGAMHVDVATVAVADAGNPTVAQIDAGASPLAQNDAGTSPQVAVAEVDAGVEPSVTSDAGSNAVATPEPDAGVRPPTTPIRLVHAPPAVVHPPVHPTPPPPRNVRVPPRVTHPATHVAPHPHPPPRGHAPPHGTAHRPPPHRNGNRRR
jgi:hypothetical protein